ncbi:MAG TPA: TonB-dependent receptor [Ferruginibacter sp.]|nr:TonB-dependent receptor [Ferruginibacter sp.]HMP21295.1 TonB-dependent receptor [Ferruginibacter sp.]
MLKIFTLFTVTLICSINHSYAQTGSITAKLEDDTDKKPIIGATVALLLRKDSSLVMQTVSDRTGTILFNKLAPDSFIIQAKALDYQDLWIFLTLKEGENDMGIYSMFRKGKDLDAVTIVSKAPPVSQKDDTLQYNASQFKVNPDATAEDIIKKMPGITVDRAGTVTAQGEQVRKITVDGKDFFGDDATAALRNLPAEIIDKIQVFDRLSDQAQFTGFDDGNATRAINIVTKTGTRNGQFGRVYAGYGTDERYAVGGNMSFFNGDRRISIAGLFNNINQQNFSGEDLLGVTSSSGGGGRQGGRGGGGGGGNRNNMVGGSNNFLVGQQSGISSTNAIGINYGDKWGTKTDVAGSYFFNNSNTGNNQLSNAEYFLQDTASQIYDETTLSNTNNYNHRINMRIEHKMDSSNSFIFTPSISFQDNNNINSVDGIRYYTLNDLISSTTYKRNSSTSGFNSNNNLLYRHAFSKRGRTLSVNMGVAANRRNGDILLESINQFYNTGSISDSIQQQTTQLVNGTSYSGNIAYTEPLGKQSQLQLSYAPSLSKNKSDQQVNKYDILNDKYAIFDSSLSNKFDNTVKTHNASINYRRGNRENMFAIGISYRNTTLNSEQLFPQPAVVNKTFSNLLPNVMWRRKFSAKHSMQLFYRANTNVPSVTQLQDVVNNNNPLFLTTGNPDLKQQVSNTVSGRYTFTNTSKGKSFMANFFVQQANDYITNATYIAANDSTINNNIILYKGAQLTRPVNLDGFLSVRSFLTYAMPLKWIKSNINLNGGFTWAKTPGMVNYVVSSTNNYTYSGGAVLSSNISEYVDFNLSYNINYSIANNALLLQQNNKFTIQNAGLQINLLSKNGWFLQNDVNNQSFSGLSSGFNQNFWLWNAGIGKKFLKGQAGELKLSVFDLLKQNRSISRTVTESFIEDVQNQALTQYFMLSFTYKLKNFGTAKTTGRPASGPGR